MTTTTLTHPMRKRTEVVLKTVTIVLLLAYIILCAITCIANKENEKEPQWMEWESGNR